MKTPDNLCLKKKPIDVKSGGRTGHRFDLGFKVKLSAINHLLLKM